MADQPVIFTEQEQLQLQQLEGQANGFNNFKNLVSRSLYAGQDATLAAQLIQFLTEMTQQSSKQLEEIRSNAVARTAASKQEQKAS
jgi:hypothetical protein